MEPKGKQNHKANNQALDDFIQNNSFFLQYEHNNMAWGPNHHGYLINSQGYIYECNLFNNWNEFKITKYASKKTDSYCTFGAFGFEGIISCEDLYNNFIKCSKRNHALQPIKLNLEEVVLDIDNSNYTKESMFIIDGGLTTNYLISYDKKNNFYKRQLIKCYGDFNYVSKSPFTTKILSYFP